MGAFVRVVSYDYFLCTVILILAIILHGIIVKNI